MCEAEGCGGSARRIRPDSGAGTALAPRCSRSRHQGRREIARPASGRSPLPSAPKTGVSEPWLGSSFCPALRRRGWQGLWERRGRLGGRFPGWTGGRQLWRAALRLMEGLAQWWRPTQGWPRSSQQSRSKPPREAPRGLQTEPRPQELVVRRSGWRETWASPRNATAGQGRGEGCGLQSRGEGPELGPESSARWTRGRERLMRAEELGRAQCRWRAVASEGGQCGERSFQNETGAGDAT